MQQGGQVFDVKNCLQAGAELSVVVEFIPFEQKLRCQFGSQVRVAQRNKGRPLGQTLRNRIVFNPSDQVFFGKLFQSCFRDSR